jgi:hypothetical protein
LVVARPPAQRDRTERGNAHHGLLVGHEQRPTRITFTGTLSFAPYADARGLDEHVAEGGVGRVEEPNRCPVAVAATGVQSAAHTVAYGGEALALIEGVDQQSRLWQNPVGGHTHRLIEDDHPYIVEGVFGKFWRTDCFLGWQAVFGVGVSGSLYEPGRTRLVGRVQRDVGGQVLFYDGVGAMPRGKEDPRRDQGARADRDALAFELPGRGAR